MFAIKEIREETDYKVVNKLLKESWCLLETLAYKDKIIYILGYRVLPNTKTTDWCL